MLSIALVLSGFTGPLSGLQISPTPVAVALLAPALLLAVWANVIDHRRAQRACRAVSRRAMTSLEHGPGEPAVSEVT